MQDMEDRLDSKHKAMVASLFIDRIREDSMDLQSQVNAKVDMTAWGGFMMTFVQCMAQQEHIMNEVDKGRVLAGIQCEAQALPDIQARSKEGNILEEHRQRFDVCFRDLERKVSDKLWWKASHQALLINAAMNNGVNSHPQDAHHVESMAHVLHTGQIDNTAERPDLWSGQVGKELTREHGEGETASQPIVRKQQGKSARKAKAKAGKVSNGCAAPDQSKQGGVQLTATAAKSTPDAMAIRVMPSRQPQLIEAVKTQQLGATAAAVRSRWGLGHGPGLLEMFAYVNSHYGARAPPPPWYHSLVDSGGALSLEQLEELHQHMMKVLNGPASDSV